MRVRKTAEKRYSKTMSSSSEEDPDSPAVPPGLFNDRNDSVSVDVDVDEPESYDSPPGLFDAEPPQTPKSMTSEDSFDPPGLEFGNPPALTTTRSDTVESIPKLIMPQTPQKSHETWFGDDDDIDAEQVDDTYEEDGYEEDPPGIFAREENQDEENKQEQPQGLLRTASSRTLNMKRVRSNNNMKTREKSLTRNRPREMTV